MIHVMASRGVFLLLALVMLSVTVPACGPEQCEIVLGAPLTVIAVAPSHGASSVDVETDILIAFSDELDADSAASAISLLAGDAVVSTQLELLNDGRIASLAPTAPLTGASIYTIAIANHLTGLNTGQLGVEMRYRFTTR